MTHYLLSVHTGADAPSQSMTDDEARHGFEVVSRLEAEMTAADALVFSGRLTDASRATVVNARNGKVVVTDGPYVEAKESIGGFYIVEAEDLVAAQRWAEKTSAAIGMSIEVRPFVATRQV
jgi:hypothetical protein